MVLSLPKQRTITWRTSYSALCQFIFLGSYIILKVWSTEVTYDLSIPTIFFFLESFNLWRPLLVIAIYHQTKTLISFWCRQRLNPKSLIQPSETLPIELTWTHQFLQIFNRLQVTPMFTFPQIIIIIIIIIIITTSL